MNFFDKFFNRKKDQTANEAADEYLEAEPALYGDGAETLMRWLGIGNAGKGEMSEITYFTCIKRLSEAMGKLPLKFYQETAEGKKRLPPTDVSRLLTVRPNPYMTPFTLMCTTEFYCQHYGNGYIWMQQMFTPEKYGGKNQVVALYPMQPWCVTVIIDNTGIFGGKGGLYYSYNDPKTGEEYMFRADDVMHFKTWYSKDGITGESVRNVLCDAISGAAAQQQTMNTLNKQGVTASMIMQYAEDLDDKRVKKLQKKFGEQLMTPKNAGKIVPVPAGLKLTPLNMSMADAEFAELRKFSALQIAAAFGIKPNQINDYSKSSYANSEMQQLDFLVDTLMARTTMYEQEINAKLLTPEEIEDNKYYKFNERAILRADTSTQMEALAKGVNNFIYKPNEARDYLDLPMAEGGDELVGNGNYIKISQVGDQYKSSREGGEQWPELE